VECCVAGDDSLVAVVFDGIRQQIEHDLLDFSPVCIHHKFRAAQIDADIALGGLRANDLNTLGEQLEQAKGILFQAHAA